MLFRESADSPASDPQTVVEKNRRKNLTPVTMFDQVRPAKEARRAFADQRMREAAHSDDIRQMRKQLKKLRQSEVASREDILLTAMRMQSTFDSHLAKLREANENLVIASVDTQMMADKVKKIRDQMSYMAHHDFLTGLPNRKLLEERLTQAISLARRHGTRLAVLFIDLDRFKTINDSLGHATGDGLLRLVAQRLLSSVRASDTVSRQGGDEFVLVLSEVLDVHAVAKVADKICETVSANYTLAGQELHIGTTIGISMYPDDGVHAEALIRHADVAMYHGKKSLGSNYSFFKPEMTVRAVQRQKVEADLYRALAAQEFQLYYQPQVDLLTGRIVGVEALIRWRHPELGLLLPRAFIPIAEECGAIVPIGRWVLHEACRQTMTWLEAGLAVPVIAVNISAIEFETADFMESVCAILLDTRLEPHYVELEITESALMKNAKATMNVLQELKRMGIRIAIDDFGTGYSSLSYLQRFPVDTLKIDHSFVEGIEADGADCNVLINLVVDLGHSLGHQVIAEGIETAAQLKYLVDHLCLKGQGNYFSEPLSADQFATVLQARLSDRPA
ncbi:bifunctional diguanylate cyclase/phosphodiesterase [Pusillimonas sp. ANT_WB101]|uniref:putative bifunctional diguanylate cyclase/phosphodiesterase n=1 Tax=Pusillimonas sp. ANT_WB101 TaxID=2597356 RepID=UPI00165D58B6|nr:EAL domain-containing protein [Pusillimonas sp. ANT_WB101]